MELFQWNWYMLTRLEAGYRQKSSTVGYDGWIVAWLDQTIHCVHARDNIQKSAAIVCSQRALGPGSVGLGSLGSQTGWYIEAKLQLA